MEGYQPSSLPEDTELSTPPSGGSAVTKPKKSSKKNEPMTMGLEEGLKKAGVKGSSLSQKNEEQIRAEIEKMNGINSILSMLTNSGLPTPNKVSINVEAEWDQIKTQYRGLPNVPSHILGEYLDKFCTVLGYAYYCLGIADYESMTTRTQKEFAFNQLFLIQPTMSNRDTQAAMVHSEELYQELANKHLIEYGKWKIIASLVSNYEKKYESISREITRRGNEGSQTGRNNNVGNSF